MTVRSPREARLFSLYRLSGSALPFDVWLKHYRTEQAKADAIALPRSFWVAVAIIVASFGVTAGVIGRVAGWW